MNIFRKHDLESRLKKGSRSGFLELKIETGFSC